MLKKIIIFLTLILWPINLGMHGHIPSKMPDTIFNKDYQAEQLILRNIHLYPNVFLARLFQNKGRIYFDKFTGNFFALTDPNNYFFGLHPRPIVPDNKNLFKFPFVAIVFFFYGLLFIHKYKYGKVLGLVSLALLLFLSTLANFDGYDFLLWLPVSLVIIHGANVMEQKNKKLFTAAAIIFLIFAIPEIIRAFIK